MCNVKPPVTGHQLHRPKLPDTYESLVKFFTTAYNVAKTSAYIDIKQCHYKDKRKFEVKALVIILYSR